MSGQRLPRSRSTNSHFSLLDCLVGGPSLSSLPVSPTAYAESKLWHPECVTDLLLVALAAVKLMREAVTGEHEFSGA